jgi:hypothetical protein
LMTEYSEIGMEARRSHTLKLRMSDPRSGLLHKKAAQYSENVPLGLVGYDACLN